MLARLLAFLGFRREADAPLAPPGPVPVVAVGEAAQAAPSPRTAVDLIAEFEGFQSRPYRCPAGKPTIGYGTTIYPDGRAVTMDDPPCTKEQARQWLLAALHDIDAAIRIYVKVPLTQGQTDALRSFIYNFGPAKFSRSTLLRLLNKSDYGGACEQFALWVHADGKVLAGLVRRRAAEAALFRGAA